MNTYTGKIKKNTNLSIANNLSKTKKYYNFNCLVLNNRSEAIAQRKLQEIAENYSSKSVIQCNGLIGNFYTGHDLPVLNEDLIKESVGYAGQGKHVTKKLMAGEYIFTADFTACTAFSIWDPTTAVASIAHFDSMVKTQDITDMVDEMIALGANVPNMQFGVVGDENNLTLKTVWRFIDPRLNPLQLPQLTYPPPNIPIQGPPNLYYGKNAMVAANGWLGRD